MTESVLAAGPKRPSAGRTCRVSERIACDVPVSCQPPSALRGSGPNWPARVRDVSSTGLSLILRRRFEAGSGLAVELPAADGGAPSIVLARVVRIQAAAEGFWVLGCAFISPLSDEELEGLVSPGLSEIPRPPADEDSLPGVSFRGVLLGGEVVERFIRRLNVQGPWPLKVGQVIGLRFHFPSGSAPVARVRVDECRSSDGRWRLACTFLSVPPAEFLPASY